MVTYRERLREIEALLGTRRLVYFGTRGSDARALTSIRQFDAVFSQIAPLGVPGIEEVCLETLKGERVDLNRYSIDLDPSDAVRTLRCRMLETFGRPAAVMAYRPSAVLASAWFPRADRVQYLGLFHEHQAAFEHKPWVETQLAAAGIPVLPWTYYADHELPIVREIAAKRSIVLRANRSDGGAGLSLVTDARDLERAIPPHGDGFFAVAPLLADSVPLNVAGCVFPGGGISMHPASLQLIGIPALTTRCFGYCGNDFARVADLDRDLVDSLGRIAETVGGWLASKGYLGAFGVDALVHDGRVYLTELNPRFQGSSRLSAEIAMGLDLPDIFLDHLAAFLGFSGPDRPLRLGELASRQRPCAHVVCQNTQARPCAVHPVALDGLAPRCDLVPAPNIAVQVEGTLVDALFDRGVTAEGKRLLPDVDVELRRVLRLLNPRDVESGLAQ